MTSNRRTFAIISHPDAGKTTLTEKLLLQGGAIHLAGEVKARGAARRARSDWMKIEQQRGISVTSSVMTFQKDGIVFNLLDTPGHEDFSEDTYRTLTAVDSAVMVIDAAKGIEPQTLKLFEVCRLRDIPIITFINKLDREAQDPMALLDDIASRLQLDPAPIWWPAESGNRLRGMVEVGTGRFQPYTRKAAGSAEDPEHPPALPLDQAAQYFEAGEQENLAEAVELVEGGYPAFDRQAFLEGHMTPVLWGSALRHFGIDELLKAIGDWAPQPKTLSKTVGGPQWSWALLVVVLLTVTNLFSVGNYGEFEFWFALVKVVAIVGFIGLGVLAILGILPTSDVSGVHGLTDHGFFGGGVGGIFAAMLTTTTTYLGTEIVTIAAAESKKMSPAAGEAGVSSGALTMMEQPVATAPHSLRTTWLIGKFQGVKAATGAEPPTKRIRPSRQTSRRSPVFRRGYKGPSGRARSRHRQRSARPPPDRRWQDQ